MTSHLRLQASFEPFTAHATYQASPTLPPAKKQKMSLAQTYDVASTARAKLGREAGRADHDLRLLVGHANLLDSLMVELADAEREQDAWFHRSVQKASSRREEPRHVQWIDAVAVEDGSDDDSDLWSQSDDYDDDDDDDDYDSGSDVSSCSSDGGMFNIPLQRIPSPPVALPPERMDHPHSSCGACADPPGVARRSSHHSPPDLTLDSESDSSDDDDESIPSAAPPHPPAFDLAAKHPPRTPTPTHDIFSSHPPAIDTLLTHPHHHPVIAAC